MLKVYSVLLHIFRKSWFKKFHNSEYTCTLTLLLIYNLIYTQLPHADCIINVFQNRINTYLHLCGSFALTRYLICPSNFALILISRLLNNTITLMAVASEMTYGDLIARRSANDQIKSHR